MRNVITRLRSRSTPTEPKLYQVQTRDGWRIALHRYKRAPGQRASSPVLLCHGLGSNRFDLDAPDNSLARYLYEAGHDTWVIELRGAGKSSRPTLTNRLRYDWNFDDYLYHDLPAAIGLIHRRTGADKVHWIGHSMGGMLAYAYLAMWGDRSIRSVVTVGSPTFAKMRRPMIDNVIGLYRLARPLRRVPNRALGRLASHFPRPVKNTVGRLIMNPRQVSAGRAKRLLRSAVEDIPITLLDQFVDWYSHQEFRLSYGTFDFREALRHIVAPTFVISGSRDWLTPPSDLEQVYELLGSSEKRYWCAGKEAGCEAEYGHIDLILGRHAPVEIFPRIADWLQHH